MESDSQSEEFTTNVLRDSICIVQNVDPRHSTKMNDTIKFVKDEDDNVDHNIVIPGSSDKKSALIMELDTTDNNG